MNFLTPLFLLGGLAIAGPIIYHLVRRTTREKLRFSSLMFLQPSPPRLSRRHRLEHLLLLLLRCAALALLALGFSRPFLRQTPIDDPTAAKPRRVVLLLDTSASMRREGVWAAARARVEAVLRQAAPTDQVALYTFERRATALMGFDEWDRAAPSDRVAFALSRVGGLAPGWGGTHLGNALVTAAEALAETEGKSAPGPRQIVLISDLQAGSRLDALQAYEWPKGVELTVEAVKAANPTNAGVQIVADGPESARAPDAPVRVRVSNASDSKGENFKLGWLAPAPAGTVAPPGPEPFLGTPLEAYVPPGQSRIFSLPLPKEGRAAAGRVAVQGDDEAFDNTAYFIPPVQQRATVLWVGGEAPADTRQPLFFLQRALAETPRVAVKVVGSAPTAPLAPAEVAAAQLIFVADAVPTETAAALRAQATAGKTVVFLPRKGGAGEGATLGALAGREPVRVEDWRPPSYAMFADIDFQHPLFAPFADPRYSDFTKIRFWRTRKFDAAELGGTARVLARFDHGAPALVELPVGQGRLLVLASGWHPEDSQFAVSSKFVPLVWSLLESSGSVATFVSHYVVAEPVALPAGPTATAVTVPDGSSVALAAGATAFADTRSPGIYTVVGGGREQRFAVNLDANESRTVPLGLDELEQLGVPVTRTKPAGPEVTAAQKTLLQGIEAESRQKLWRWFIAATLAVLLFESALAGWTAKRAASQPNEVTP